MCNSVGKALLILPGISHVGGAGDREIKALSGCFAQLPQRVIWKMRHPEQLTAEEHAASNLSSNIKVRVKHCM